MSNSSVPILDVTSGPNVATSELTVDGTDVNRQQIVDADPTNAAGLGEVDSVGQRSVSDRSLQELFRYATAELRVISYLIAEGSGIRDDLENLRASFLKELDDAF